MFVLIHALLVADQLCGLRLGSVPVAGVVVGLLVAGVLAVAACIRARLAPAPTARSVLPSTEICRPPFRPQ